MGDAMGEFWTKIRLSTFFNSVSLFFGLFFRKKEANWGLLLDFLVNF
jgi:hypothetical protein